MNGIFKTCFYALSASNSSASPASPDTRALGTTKDRCVTLTVVPPMPVFEIYGGEEVADDGTSFVARVGCLLTLNVRIRALSAYLLQAFFIL